MKPDVIVCLHVTLYDSALVSQIIRSITYCSQFVTSTQAMLLLSLSLSEHYGVMGTVFDPDCYCTSASFFADWRSSYRTFVLETGSVMNLSLCDI